MDKWDEPDCKGAALILAVSFFALFAAVAVGAWAYFR